MNTKGIKILGSRVLLKIDRTNEITRDSGIIVNYHDKVENQIGEIIAVGKSCWENRLKVGKKVAYAKYGAEDTSELGEQYIFVEEVDILGIVEE